MEDQAEFVRWWEENVPSAGRPEIGTAPRRFSREQAETLTEISHQQTSKWRRRLKEPEKYQAMLYGAAYHKAVARLRWTLKQCPHDTVSSEKAAGAHRCLRKVRI